MLEEAMSETMMSIVSELSRDAHLRLAGILPPRRRNLDVDNNICPPAHNDDEESKWYGIPFADREITRTLGIGVLWILESGERDPRLSYPGLDLEQALEAWYTARWWPERLNEWTPVDRIGNPREELP